VLQADGDGGWQDMYAFAPEPVPRVDVEVSNWFTSTHPRSPFVTGLVVSTQAADGARAMLSDWTGELTLTESTPARTVASAVSPEQLPGLLERRFGLPAQALG
jgi:N-hydroxyarylamine O-acetyltransferase